MPLLPKRRSRRSPPRREVSGIVLPEFILWYILQPLERHLASDRYGYDSIEEPVFASFSGFPRELSDQVFTHLRTTPPRVVLGFQNSDRVQLPIISIVPEAMTPTAEMIGRDASLEEEEVVQVTNEVLTPVGGAVGGETTFKLQRSDVSVGSEIISYTRGGSYVPLYSVYNEYVLSTSGVVTLTSPLIAGDILTANRYSYYGLPGGDYYATGFDFTHVIFIDTWNPLVTSALLGIIWRELMTKKDEIQDLGLFDLELSRRSQSLWEASQPAYGYRSELVVTGYTEWHAYRRGEFPRTISVDMDTTSGDESVVRLEADIASLGVNTTPDEGL